MPHRAVSGTTGNTLNTPRHPINNVREFGSVLHGDSANMSTLDLSLMSHSLLKRLSLDNKGQAD